MKDLLIQFKALLYDEKKYESVDLIMNELKSNSIDIVTLYTKILAPSLNTMICEEEEKESFIWKEHIRSSIIRTIIENSFFYVMKEKNDKYKFEKKGKVLVICPEEEYHELGARMAADFFELAGYDSIFVGANTPKNDFINSIKILNVDYVTISVTNPYNVFSIKDTIKRIKAKNPGIKIIVGGHAFDSNPLLLQQVNADYHVKEFKDILALEKEEIL